MSITFPRFVIKKQSLACLTALLVFVGIARADLSDTFFDDSYVHEIRLTIDDPNWHDTLYDSHINDPEDPYFEASFSCDGVELPQIGVRMKGNSSMRIGSNKKSLKLDFDEFDEENEELSFLGLKKLNLNNGFKDPSLMREKLFLDFASQYIPTIRAVHTRVYVNDEYLGLYTAVDQVNKSFIERGFGSGEDGNLYKGAASDDIDGGPQSDFGSDLAWVDSQESSYYDRYQLKTNEEENDYSGLVDMIYALNNEDPDSFPEKLEPLLDVDNILAGLALNSLFSNLDSYTGSAHNYYVYQSDSTGQFSHILWDTNETFGTFSMFAGRSDMRTLDPFWLPSGEYRPLMEKLWENEAYAEKYLSYHAQMLREGFNVETMSARIEELANLIRGDVYADNNKQYSNTAFETNLNASSNGAYGLTDFVEQRASYLQGILNGFADVSDLRINEIVTTNTSSFVDSSGHSDPWIEIYNPGLGLVNLSGLYLSESNGNPTQWALPNVNLDDGEYLVIWLDGATSEGTDHANFTPSISGGDVFLYRSGGSLIDQVSYPALGSDYSYQRLPDGDAYLMSSNSPTPGSSNVPGTSASVALYINEIMAENDATLQDPSGQGFPDWFEIYNPNSFIVDMGGMYLTDNIDIPQKWQIPAGVIIEPNGFLAFWADNDEEQGPLHANFKLSSDGEEIALFDSDANGNLLIDYVEFGPQSSDISYGREFDGALDFTLFEVPTPGASNLGGSGQTFLDFPVQNLGDQMWIDTGDWIGWAEVSYEPWLWNTLWNNWIYLSESLSDSTGSWIWMMNPAPGIESDLGNGLFLGFGIQVIDGKQWVDTGDWLGWLEVSSSPWIWNVNTASWIYVNTDHSSNASVWFKVFY